MTFELYKSTYMSASHRLEDGHKKRADELKKHAAKQGISAFHGKEGFDRIYPHRFIFENHQDCRRIDDFLGKFFITNFRQSSRFGIDVEMKSDYGKTIYVELVVGEVNGCLMNIKYGYQSEINNFKFDNRKDALKFRNFIINISKDGGIEDGINIFNLESMPINALYTTE